MGIPRQNVDGFDARIYRTRNPDLQRASDEECRAHFDNHGVFERRIFGPVASVRDRLSMRWLRGSGIEIGAGRSPLRLFGAAEACYADTDENLLFGGGAITYKFALDDRELFDKAPRDSFDFAIASHVLEHVDSFVRGVQNLIDLVKPGGVVYAALPILEFSGDRSWMQRYDFQHHVEEFTEPGKYADLHDSCVTNHVKGFVDAGANMTGTKFRSFFSGDEFERALAEEKLPPGIRFVFHKHNYTYQEWIEVILQSLAFLENRAELVDSAFGDERLDCNVILRRKP